MDKKLFRKTKLKRNLSKKIRTRYPAGVAVTFGGRTYNDYATRLRFAELYQLFNTTPLPLGTPSLNFNSGVDLTGMPIIPMDQGPIQVDPNRGPADGTIIEISTDPTFSDPTQTVYTYDGPAVETKDIPVSQVGGPGDENNPPTYYMRVRNKLGVNLSPWSEVVNFTLVVNTGIQKPVIQQEDNRVIHATQLVPTGNWNPVHTKSDWEVATDGAMSNIVFTSYNDSINLTDIVLGSLTSGWDYFVRVRYYAGTTVSEWSDPYQFHAESFIYRPLIVYPTFHDNGTNSIVVSEHDNVTTPYPNPRMIVEWRYKDGINGTWTAWTLLDYAYNDLGVYDVYLEDAPNGVERHFEVRCRYRKYVGPNPTDYVYSGYSNVYYTTVDRNNYIGSGGYLTSGTGNGYYKFVHSMPSIWGSLPNRVRYEVYKNRELTDLVTTWTGDFTLGAMGELVTSPYWQKEKYGYVHHWLPSEVLYIRARKVDITSGMTTVWSDVKTLDLTAEGLPEIPTIVDPADGSTGKNNGYFNMSTVNPLVTVSTATKPLYIQFEGLQLELGTSLDSNGNPTNLIERFPYYKSSPSTTHSYMTGELEPNTTYYARMRYLYNPELPTSQWTPTITFTTGSNTIPRFSHTETLRIGGELGRGIPRNPLFFYEDQTRYHSGTVYGADACLHIVVEDLSTGDLVVNINPEGRFYYTNIFAIQTDPDVLTKGGTYRVHYRFAKDLAHGIGSSARAEKWRYRDFNVSRNSNILEPTTVGGSMGNGTRYGYTRADGVRFCYVGRGSSTGYVYKSTTPGTWTMLGTLSRRYNREAVIWNSDMNRLEVCGHDANNTAIDGHLMDLDTGSVDTSSRPYSQHLPGSPPGMHGVRGTYDPSTQSSFVFGGGYGTPLNTVTKWANSANAPTFPTPAVVGVYFGAIDIDSNGNIYRMGGTATTTTLGNNNNRCFKYNTTTDTWTEIAPLHENTKYLLGVYHPDPNGKDGFLLTKNGYSTAGYARQPYVMWYDNTTDTWDYLWKANASGSNGIGICYYDSTDGYVYRGDDKFSTRFKLGE